MSLTECPLFFPSEIEPTVLSISSVSPGAALLSALVGSELENVRIGLALQSCGVFEGRLKKM